jgi:thiosulfate/3-mercaptopyruvate sulfurtransferase
VNGARLIQPAELASRTGPVIIDCRFSLADPGRGRADYLAGHVPGAHYLDLEEDLSGPVGAHGGRHPLPDANRFAATLARLGVGHGTEVIAYDDSGFAFSARLWWMMRSLGFRPPQLLDGGYQGFLQAGGRPETGVPYPRSCTPAAVTGFAGCCDIGGLRQLQGEGALLVDSREERRYLGLEEPIDPVAGHIPGAVNRPWQGVTSAGGRLLDEAGLRAHWGDVLEAERLVLYCGSGVSACANLFSLSLLGRDDAILYTGSWSDWCSYL